jgi:hypothetical protein
MAMQFLTALQHDLLEQSGISHGQAAKFLHVQEEKFHLNRRAISAAMSTASIATVEKSVPQTIGRSSFLGFEFPFIIFLQLGFASFFQGRIATFRTPSRREPKRS